MVLVCVREITKPELERCMAEIERELSSKYLPILVSVRGPWSTFGNWNNAEQTSWPSWLKVSERRRKFLVLAKRQRSFPFLVFEVKEISQRVSNQALKRNRSLEPIPSSQISHSVSFCSQNSGKKTRIGNWNNTPKIGKTTWEQNLTEFVAEFEVLVSEQSEKITKIWNGDG